MSVKIGHAVMDENGKTDGPITGDQTGKEIQISNWYLKDWEYYIEAKDANVRELAAYYVEQICKDDDFGYSQQSTKRWTGYKAIKSNNNVVNGAKGDFDCSSLVISTNIFGGIVMSASGYTGSMYSKLKATGKYNIYTDDKHIKTCDYAKRGGIYLRNGHVLTMLENGSKYLESTANTEPTTTTSIPATDYEILGIIKVDKIKSWCNVRAGASLDSSIIGRAQKNNTYNLIGVESEWYMINYNGNVAYISKDLCSIDDSEQKDEDQYGAVKVTGAKVNVRTGPATTYPIVTTVVKGTLLDYLGEKTTNGWYKVECADQEAYISSTYSIRI